MKYYLDKKIDRGFDETVTKIKNLLPNYGFGVVTEFDLDEKFKDKLGVEYAKYKILGACNPKYAYEAIQLEPMVGTMLPCNIVIKEINNNHTLVAAINPIASMLAIENEKLKEAANQIKEMLAKLVAEL